MSFKDLQRQLVTVQTLEYHNKNWTWTNMLMEVKKDYKNAIVHQVCVCVCVCARACACMGGVSE